MVTRLVVGAVVKTVVDDCVVEELVEVFLIIGCLVVVEKLRLEMAVVEGWKLVVDSLVISNEKGGNHDGTFDGTSQGGKDFGVVVVDRPERK